MSILESATGRQRCCALHERPIGEDEANQMARLLKALADSTRLRLLSFITAQGCEHVTARELSDTLEITQATVSHHLAKLVEAGILTREQVGKRARYTVQIPVFDELRTFLDLG